MINLPYNCLKIFLLILTNSLSLLKLVLENIKVFLFTSLIDLQCKNEHVEVCILTAFQLVSN